MIQCTRCGLEITSGFKYCHHCGQHVKVPAPEPIIPAFPAFPVLEKEPEGIEQAAKEFGQFEESGLTEPKPELDEPDTLEEFEEEFDEEFEGDYEPEITAGGMYLFELICKIPIINVFVLAVISFARYDSVMRTIARAKLLSALTVTAVLLLSLLLVFFLIYLEIIEPIYLGRWRH